MVLGPLEREWNSISSFPILLQALGLPIYSLEETKFTLKSKEVDKLFSTVLTF